MKYVMNYCCLATLLLLTAGCVTSQSTAQFLPITQAVSPDSVTIFLLERDLPPVIERLGTVAIHTYVPSFSVHQKVEGEVQKVGRQKGANGAFRVGHGTYTFEHDGLVTYLLFRYTK